MVLRAAGTFIRPLVVDDAERMLEVRLRNAAFLAPFEPRQSLDSLTLAAQRRDIEKGLEEAAAGRGFPFGVFAAPTGALIGRVSLSNVVRMAWQNATLGYFIDRAHNARGHATEAVGLALRFAFREAHLHRVQAATLLHNGASKRVLEKNGFRFEGIALRYLCINGRWEDHRIYAVTAEEWSEREATETFGGARSSEVL